MHKPNGLTDLFDPRNMHMHGSQEQLTRRDTWDSVTEQVIKSTKFASLSMRYTQLLCSEPVAAYFYRHWKIRLIDWLSKV